LTNFHGCSFSDFLKKHVHEFLNPREPEEVRPDPALTNQFLQFFREAVESSAGSALPVDELFRRVVTRFGEDTCGTLFKTPLDLSTFLRIYSHIFHIQAHMVTLVPQRSFPSITASQNNNNKVNNFTHYSNRNTVVKGTVSRNSDRHKPTEQ
jgi:hypothetical protein